MNLNNNNNNEEEKKGSLSTLLLDFGLEDSDETTKGVATAAAAEPTPAAEFDLLDISGPSSQMMMPAAAASSSRSSTTCSLKGSQSAVDLLAFGVSSNGSSSQLIPKSPSSSNNEDNMLLGDFSGPISSTKPILPEPMGVSLMMSSTSTTTNTADDLVNDFLEGLDRKKTLLASTASTASKKQPQPKLSSSSQINQPKPNYNSSAFYSTSTSTNSSSTGSSSLSASSGFNLKPKVSQDTFNDLLGGFSSSSSSSAAAAAGPEGGAAKTIGQMKKREEMRYMSPEEARVFKWKDGKARNIRALLCSLETVLWEDARWNRCGMHQLVAKEDVKKMYRKACLAVHPDKQTGTDNEELSKLIFMELNDAWSDFDKV